MLSVEETTRKLADKATARPPRPSNPITLLLRAPNSVRWRLVRAYRLLKREATGLIHRIQGRRIVHLLHIGKTGGTAIKSVLKGQEHSGDYELVLHEHEFALKHVPFGEKVIFVVRDPISRFVSGFYGRKRQDLPRHNVPWDPGEEVAFRQFDTPNELALALTDESAERRAAAVEAMKNILHLKSPHWKWFQDEAYFIKRKEDILFIGFQDSLNDDFERLKKVLNLPEGVRLPDDDVSAHKNPAQNDRRLDDEAIRNLKAWYYKDYKFLELCREFAGKQAGRPPGK
jgi:hypothetical protein